jgi:serine/threonine-protein phosphatase 5
VRQLNFFAAIELADEPSAAEGLDLDSMTIEPDYDGVKLENEMTQEFVDDMIERFKNGKKIHKKYVYQIVIAVKNIVYEEATMVEVKIPDDVKLTVCGDTHGKNAYSLRRIVKSANHGHRPILRLVRTLQIEWATCREALVPVQR